MRKFLLKVLLMVSFLLPLTFAAPEKTILDDGKLSQQVQNWQWKLTVGDGLKQTIRGLFYPGNDWWFFYNSLMRIGVLILLFFLMWAGTEFILNANDENKRKKAQLSFLYILYGTALFFGANWILTSGLKLWSPIAPDELVRNTSEAVLLATIWILRALAYFVAIILIIYFWYKIIAAFDKEDKIANARRGVMNVAIALAFIGVIEFIYGAASRSTFRTEIWDFLVRVAKVLWWVIGASLVLMILYAGVLLITSRWDEEAYQKAKTILKVAFIIIIIIALFLLLFYQLFWELTKLIP